MRHTKQHKQLMGFARKQLDRHFAVLRKQDLWLQAGGGRVRAIRDALGMTTTQLAKRLGVSQPRITRLEKAEKDGSITLASLRRAAEALDCTLVYALLPNEPLEDMVRERAQKIADELVARTHHTMKLEDQPLQQRDLESARERLVADLLQGDLARLWDEP